VEVTDRFDTTNDFNGAEFGLEGEYRYGRWVLEGQARVALGQTSSAVDISGATSTTVPGFSTQSQSGGLLALSSNSGRFTKDRFGVVPEVGIKIGYQITSHLRAQVGYDFLFWNDVLRAGSQIDTVVNPNLQPPVIAGGPNRPAPRIDDPVSVWVHGVTFGLEYRF
jgi:hypothetical protein